MEAARWFGLVLDPTSSPDRRAGADRDPTAMPRSALDPEPQRARRLSASVPLWPGSRDDPTALPEVEWNPWESGEPPSDDHVRVTGRGYGPRLSQPEVTAGNDQEGGGTPDQPDYATSSEGCTIGTTDICGRAPATPGAGLSAAPSVYDTFDPPFVEPFDFDHSPVPFTADMRALVRDAWHLLASNEDLVTWAACMGHPRREQGFGEGQCLVEWLRGDRGTVRFKRKHCRSSASMSTPPSATAYQPILFCTGEGSWFETLVDMYTDTSDFLLPDERECAVFIVAETLLHELVHVCGYSYAGDDEGDCVCSKAFLVENYFVDRGLRRFVQAANADRCLSPAPRPAGSSCIWRSPRPFNPADSIDDSDYINTLPQDPEPPDPDGPFGPPRDPQSPNLQQGR